MIDMLTGQVVAQRGGYVVLLVGGVGLRVQIPTSAYGALEGRGHTVTLYTYLLVREDALTLFGFADQEERGLFETLLTVSGVGPRLALSIVGTLTINQLSSAVASEQPEMLTRVPGIGKKLAQKLIFELKDKLAVDMATGIAPVSETDTDVIAALTALGYSVVEAQAALQSIPRDAPPDIEDRVRLALDYFA